MKKKIIVLIVALIIMISGVVIVKLNHEKIIKKDEITVTEERELNEQKSEDITAIGDEMSNEEYYVNDEWNGTIGIIKEITDEKYVIEGQCGEIIIGDKNSLEDGISTEGLEIGDKVHVDFKHFEKTGDREYSVELLDIGKFDLNEETPK